MNRLLGNLSRYWPTDKISYIQEEAGYGEYADALQNLIAIGVRYGIEVRDEDYELVRRLINDMNMSEEVRSMILRIQGEQRGFLSKAAG